MSDFTYKVQLHIYDLHIPTGNWDDKEESVEVQWSELPKFFETLAAKQSSGTWQLRSMTIEEVEE